ncbi:ankyrin repeat domain-containing protein [Wolbachia endosymbiont (group A) of Pipizella viduata]|uniref:ankyrin repeat domain-containing protein n=1 Tax=Wolbachia endosymbiont (group A) of Pipizella viduata TaxID=3066154 RepID=UPI0033408E5C
MKCFDISQLRINDHQNGYRLDFVAYDEEVKASVRIDSFEKLVAKMGTAVTIVIRDKSLPDIIKDMVRQKLSNTGADIDDKIIENSKKRSKAVIIADITGSENTTAYAVARGIAESSDNLGITVSQIQVIKGDIVLNYAVNDLNKIKLVHNGRASTSDDNRECDRLLLTNLLLVKRDIFKDVLDDCTDVEAKNESGWTFLHLASQKGMLDMAGFLLDRGANIEAEGNNGCTPLHEAVRHNKFNMVKFLVNKGANINVKMRLIEYL